MQITLHDGTTYEGADNSTTTELIIFVADMTAFMSAYNKMTNENLSEYTVGEDTAYNRTLMETKTYKWQDRIEAHFVVLPTEEQVIIEQMESRATQYADKAQAYDILMGEEVI